MVFPIYHGFKLIVEHVARREFTLCLSRVDRNREQILFKTYSLSFYILVLDDVIEPR